MLASAFAAIDALRTADLPKLVVSADGTDVTCPYCGEGVDDEAGVKELSYALEFNNAALDLDGGTVGVDQEDHDRHTLCFAVTCCNAPVDKPAGWEEAY